MSLGASSSKGSSSSEGYGYNLSSAQSGSQQQIAGGQAGHLDDLYGRANTQSLDQTGAQTLQSQNNLSMNRAFGAQSQLGTMAQTGGASAGFLDTNRELESRQIADLGTNLGNFFNEQLMPGIQGNAVGVGALGGGRQQLAQGQAAGQVAQQYQQGVTGIMANSQQARQQAAGQVDANVLGASQGIGQLGGMINNLGMSNMNADWAGLNNFAGLLGSPTVLSNSFSVGSSQSENQTSAQANNKSSSFSIGF